MKSCLVPAVRLRLLRSSAFPPLLVLNASNPDHRTLKTEHRLKIRIGRQLSHFLDLRVPDVGFLFHLSNSHAKVDPKFVTDNMQGVLAAHFGTDVEDGNERSVAREAVIDLGGGDLAYFRVQGIGVFSSSFQRARSKLDEILNAYRISEVPEKASFEIIKLGVGGTYSSRSIDLRRGRAQAENELRLHYGPDFLPWQELILSVMAKKCAGIHLLRGEPGTGKCPSSDIWFRCLEHPTDFIFSQAMNTSGSETVP